MTLHREGGTGGEQDIVVDRMLTQTLGPEVPRDTVITLHEHITRICTCLV